MDHSGFYIGKFTFLLFATCHVAFSKAPKSKIPTVDTFDVDIMFVI